MFVTCYLSATTERYVPHTKCDLFHDIQCAWLGIEARPAQAVEVGARQQLLERQEGAPASRVHVALT
jgi:hypothetical protein